MAYSKATWQEFLNVLSRPKFDKYFSLEARQEIAIRFLQIFIPFQIKEHIRACRDPKDDMFLELALAANATHLITGDKALLELHPFHDIAILSPSCFIEMLGDV
ncbi:MAG: putative toxin-antitoxin system toxin component, PIN family [Bacteroidia bacterium]|nr:putative toxin-antitoxin system toxin component, PIN family [Bacteroidia bacterium]